MPCTCSFLLRRAVWGLTTGVRPPADYRLQIWISLIGSGPAADNQAADETLQSLPFPVFKLHKFHTHSTSPQSTNDDGFHSDGRSLFRDIQSHPQNVSLREFGFCVEGTPRHGNIHGQSSALNRANVEHNWKTRRHTFILAPVLLDPFIRDTPLKELKTVAAKLAPERINVKKAHQLLPEADPANALNVFFGASGTKRSWHRISFPSFSETQSTRA